MPYLSFSVQVAARMIELKPMSPPAPTGEKPKAAPDSRASRSASSCPRFWRITLRAFYSRRPRELRGEARGAAFLTQGVPPAFRGAPNVPPSRKLGREIGEVGAEGRHVEPGLDQDARAPVPCARSGGRPQVEEQDAPGRRRRPTRRSYAAAGALRAAPRRWKSSHAREAPPGLRFDPGAVQGQFVQLEGVVAAVRRAIEVKARQRQTETAREVLAEAMLVRAPAAGTGRGR